jgi:hypothetical protein
MTAEVEHTLAEVRRLRSRVRSQAHAGAWFPVAVIAALVLSSIALYRQPFVQPHSLSISSPYWAGLPDEQHSPLLSYVFWFAGTPLAFGFIATWYRWRARRTGMSIRWRPAVAAGAGALAALAVLAAVPVQRVVSDDVLRPQLSVAWRHALLSPLLVIAVALVALGWAERSTAVGLAGGWVAVITAWQTAYGRIGQIPGWLAWLLSGGSGPALGGEVTIADLNRPGPLLITIALPLVVFAAVRGWRARGGVA